ncbi:MAG: Lrp/AsnC family transcriptional regulator [Haloferacaceae archaeon]
MTDAFVHVVVDPGAVHRAATAIDDIDQVGSVHLVTGDHDLVVQLDLDDRERLPTVVAEEIHGVTGVIDTVTNVAYPA